MKKKLLIIISVVLLLTLIVFAIFMIFANKNNENYEGKIVRIEYEYGGYPDAIWEHKIYNEGEKTYVDIHARNTVFVDFNKEVDSGILDNITEIVAENKIYEWDGFDKSDRFISDGGGFILFVEYDNGETIEAYGHMKYPDNYDRGHKALSEYLESLASIG